MSKIGAFNYIVNIAKVTSEMAKETEDMFVDELWKLWKNVPWGLVLVLRNEKINN